MPLKIVYCNQVTFVHIIIDVINQDTFQRAIYKIIRRFPMYSPICKREPKNEGAFTWVQVPRRPLTPTKKVCHKNGLELVLTCFFRFIWRLIYHAFTK